MVTADNSSTGSGEQEIVDSASCHASLQASQAECALLRIQLAEAKRQETKALRSAARLKFAAERAIQEAAQAEMRLKTIESSTVWKATWPLRKLMSRHPVFAKRARQALQVIWWAATLQLQARLRVWKIAQRGRIAPCSVIPPDLIGAVDDPARIDLPTSPLPTVSVIIPTFGQVGYTLRCLASIEASAPVTPFEVIVAEDASGHPDVAKLALVRGLRLVQQPVNLGFLRNCNSAARQARGEYLLFLNDDTQVTDGWLDTLAQLLRARPDAGAAGSKLIYPDGRLQEAGGIIWNDATGWNYGRLDHPDAPIYNYVREVDYVSGAALMVRRELFAALGGFDEHYEPAYYEDTDLAFKIRQQGLKVLFQPGSVVVHFEGVSHGTDIGSGIKASQTTNRLKFAERWSEVLQWEHFASGTHELRAREHARARRVLLVIDHYVPEPDRDAGSRLMIGYLGAFLADGWVVKFWPDNGAYRPGYTEALQAMGIEVLYGPSVHSFDDWLAANGGELDAVIVSRPDVADKYIARLRPRTKCRIAYLGHDLHFARLDLQAKTTGDKAASDRAGTMQMLERSIWQRADVSIYPSDEEAAVVRQLEPEASVVSVMPFAFDKFSAVRKAVPGTDILFVAGFGHPPNEDGAVWFTTTILPLIRKKVSAARLFIVGSNPTARVQALAQGANAEFVFLHANVTDSQLAAFYEAARVTVVPLRFGAGVKLKVVEALKEGVPLVTTPIGAQGCKGLSEVVAVVEQETLFGDAVSRLLQDDKAWEDASKGQIEYAQRNFSTSALKISLLAVFHDQG